MERSRRRDPLARPTFSRLAREISQLDLPKKLELHQMLSEQLRRQMIETDPVYAKLDVVPQVLEAQLDALQQNLTQITGRPWQMTQRQGEEDSEAQARVLSSEIYRILSQRIKPRSGIGGRSIFLVARAALDYDEELGMKPHFMVLKALYIGIAKLSQSKQTTFIRVYSSTFQEDELQLLLTDAVTRGMIGGDFAEQVLREYAFYHTLEKQRHDR